MLEGLGTGIGATAAHELGIRRECSDASAMDGGSNRQVGKKLRYTSSAGERKSAAIKSSSENRGNV